MSKPTRIFMAVHPCALHQRRGSAACRCGRSCLTCSGQPALPLTCQMWRPAPGSGRGGGLGAAEQPAAPDGIDLLEDRDQAVRPAFGALRMVDLELAMGADPGHVV